MAQDDGSVDHGHPRNPRNDGGEERATPQRSIISPAATKPSGAASVLIEITAVITIARSSSGVREVRTAMSGPLMSGVQNIAAKSATKTTGHGGRNGSTQSGTTKASMASPERRSGDVLRTAITATRLPTRAPALRAA